MGTALGHETDVDVVFPRSNGSPSSAKFPLYLVDLFSLSLALRSVSPTRKYQSLAQFAQEVFYPADDLEGAGDGRGSCLLLLWCNLSRGPTNADEGVSNVRTRHRSLVCNCGLIDLQQLTSPHGGLSLSLALDGL